MRVLHCITGLSGDGAQRMLLRLVTRLHHEGVSCAVVNLESTAPIVGQFQRAGVEVHCLGLSASLADAVRGSYAVRRLIDSLRPDVVQGWMYHANIVALTGVALSRHRPALAWNIRRGLDDLSERSLKTQAVVRGNALLSGIPTQIVYCSSESRRQHEAYGFHSANSNVLENGFDTERFSPSQQRRRTLRVRYGITDDELVIGHVGRFDPAKGHRYLLEAYGEIARTLPAVRFVLIGRGIDRVNQQILPTIERLGISQRVLLLGEQEQLEEVYPGFDIYCSASTNEGFPNAIAEAMACGVPCAVTDTGASRRLVEGAGEVVPPRRPEELARAVITLARLPAEQRMELGCRAHERISTYHSLDSVVRHYRDMYYQVARGGVHESEQF